MDDGHHDQAMSFPSLVARVLCLTIAEVSRNTTEKCRVEK